MPYELFLTTRETTEIRNTFYNILADLKLSKVQISKIIQSGRSFISWLANLGKKTLTNVSIPLGRDNLSVLVGNLNLNTINKFERKISAKETARVGKGFTLFFQMKI